MVRELYFVVAQSTPAEFEKEINAAAADGFKLIQASVTFRQGSYEAVMGKAHDTERSEVEAIAKRSGLHIPSV